MNPLKSVVRNSKQPVQQKQGASKQQTVQSNKKVVLDASIKSGAGAEKILREDIKENKLRFIFPEGLNELRVIESCRALNALENPDDEYTFDLMYDMTMQMLVGKPVRIVLLGENGTQYLMEDFQVTDRYMDLRGVDSIMKYPFIVNCLVDFMGNMLLKKFPRSYSDFPQIGTRNEEPINKKELRKIKKTIKKLNK